ncbi:hypothetical protein [Gilliamella sp. G0441]|uniref:hypothetical protein n=1 Tax=Gilliamella sp. G0441 TaxID=3384760 RepID=UPI003D32F81E
MKIIKKFIMGSLSLFFSNFVFAQDLLIEAKNVPESTLFNIFFNNPIGFILFFGFVWFFGKHFSR